MNEAAVGRLCYNPLMARGRGVSKMTWGADDGVDVRVGFHVWVGWGGVRMCARSFVYPRKYMHVYVHAY